ncbi:SDR family oxidoreductase [Nicoliella spurrieriana]|uniref:SDR family oxidoreductase n=1 Tax=Nicoliella spurrieriana TaxID=2925830 RepID=A0A976X5W4_9LACO|nr:SDR family oxidoreductase [Nicoliella spurrieriana]UQS87134.1 SDR family oxidoreductase [Nicoliella spurrieriana]
MKYGITAATGHFGQTAFKELATLVPASDIVVLVRNVDKAKQIFPAGTDIRPADYTQVDQLNESLKGVDKLIFISSQPGAGMPRAEQHHNVVNAAKQAGVQFIAYTSFPNADHAKSPLSADHKQTEQWIKESGIKYSFMRNNWYLQNDLMTIQAALKTTDFPYSAEDGKVGWTREENYAAGAARVLTADDPKAVYEFGGKPISYTQLVDELTAATGQEITPVPLTDDEYKQSLLKAGLDEATAGFVIATQDLIKAGELDVPSNDLNDVLGGKLEALSEGLRKLLK